MKVLRLIALAAFVGLCAWAALRPRPPVSESYSASRQFVIGSTIDRFDDAVVVLGDSIVEASTLPRTICGHAVINAGIGGLSTTTSLRLQPAALISKRARLVVISLGSNDAAIPNSNDTYLANYRSLLGAIKPFAAQTAIVNVPPPEAGLPEARKVDIERLDAYNAALPALARDTDATLIEIPSMPAKHTFDGVHFNAVGYNVWEKAVTDSIATIVCKAQNSR